MNRQQFETQLDKRTRRGAMKLVAIDLVIGLLLGLAVGSTGVYLTIERTIIVPLQQGVMT